MPVLQAKSRLADLFGFNYNFVNIGVKLDYSV